MDETRKATIIGGIVNFCLLIIKGIAAIMTGSIAIISDTLNSALDFVTSISTYIAVKLSKKSPDKTHPYGYKRAEPIVGLSIAILAGILAFEILKTAIISLVTGDIYGSEITLIPAILILIAIIVKIIVANYFYRVGKKNDSPAITASAADFKYDILCSSVVLIGISGTTLNIHFLDEVAAIFVSILISMSGYKIGMSNIDYLMGKSPDNETLFEIQRRTLSVSGVKKIKDIKAHFVGNYIHVEIEIYVDKELKVTQVHKINSEVKHAIEGIYHIDKAFVHIEPEEDKKIV